MWRSVAGALGHWVLRGYGLYAVEEKATGAFIGRIGLINPEGWPGLEAGWLLGRQHWGHGFATEGARAVVRMAYEALAATHVISLIRPENLASIRVAEKLGAIRESTIEMLGARAHIYAYGGPPIDPTPSLRAAGELARGAAECRIRRETTTPTSIRRFAGDRGHQAAAGQRGRFRAEST